MIKNLNIKVILIVKENANLRNIDIEKYNSQYNNLKIIYNNIITGGKDEKNHILIYKYIVRYGSRIGTEHRG